MVGGQFGGVFEMDDSEQVCGEETQGSIHLHKCRMPPIPGHLHCCYCGAFWPLDKFEDIARQSSRELFAALF